MSERKMLIFTAIAVSLVGVVTGLFVGGYLMPRQLYDVRITTTRTETSVVDNQGDHTVTRVVTTTETVPRGYNFVATTATPGIVATPTTSTPAQGANEVWVNSMDFRPGILTVPVGTKVTWINKDSEEHSVTSSTGLFDGSLGFTGSFSYTFTKAGTFEYHCVPHPEMTGSIIVK
ncbi:MAG: plastocyanin/azurin family copper-binding protein [Dehalococcoidales bacterium]|nr:plastocyanin/azurin family copper-binding protein [Dehalococcoidales bacterium]